MDSPFAGVLFDVWPIRSVVMRRGIGDDRDETVHERIRRLRERAGLKQKELAAATDDVVSEAWLQKFEKKKMPKAPTREQLEPLVVPLQTSLAYLMEPMRVCPIEEAPIASFFRGLSTADREIVERLTHRLRELTDRPAHDPPEDVLLPQRAVRS